LLSLAVNFKEKYVKLVSIVFDVFLQDLLNTWAESSEKDWFGQSEEDLMVRALHLDIDILDVNVHLRNLEKVLAIS
jgi:hypothetical protein